MSDEPAYRAHRSSHSRKAIEYLDRIRSDDPAAAPAMLTGRRVSHSLATEWMPVIARILADTSMTTWTDRGTNVRLAAHGAVGSGSTCPTGGGGEQAVDQVAEAQATTMEVDGESVPVPPDGATMVQVIPQNGDTLVVMDDVENIGGL